MTNKTALTELLIRNIPVPNVISKQYPDTLIPGFGVRVSNKGLRTFYYRYKIGSKYGRLTLGHFPDVKLATARAAAAKARVLVRDGIDPSVPVTISTEPSVERHFAFKRRHSDSVAPLKGQILFSKALDDYFNIYCAANVRPSTTREYRWTLNAHFLPRWESRTMQSITKGDVLAIINGIVKQGNFGAARHAQKYIKGFFSWAAGHDYVVTYARLDSLRPAHRRQCSHAVGNSRAAARARHRHHRR
jgi:hypothetical protein